MEGKGFPKGEGSAGPPCISRCKQKGIPVRSYRSDVCFLHAPARGQPSKVPATFAEILQGTKHDRQRSPKKLPAPPDDSAFSPKAQFKCKICSKKVATVFRVFSSFPLSSQIVGCDEPDGSRNAGGALTIHPWISTRSEMKILRNSRQALGLGKLAREERRKIGGNYHRNPRESEENWNKPW